MNHDIESKERGIVISPRNVGKTNQARKEIQLKIEELEKEREDLGIVFTDEEFDALNKVEKEIETMRFILEQLPKPTIGVIGHIDHGSTTLTAAYTRALTQHNEIHIVNTRMSDEDLEKEISELNHIISYCKMEINSSYGATVHADKEYKKLYEKRKAAQAKVEVLMKLRMERKNSSSLGSSFEELYGHPNSKSMKYLNFSEEYKQLEETYYGDEFRTANRSLHRQAPKNADKKAKAKRNQAKQAKRKNRKK